MVCLSRPYSFKFFKDCLPQVSLGPFLNTRCIIYTKMKSPIGLTVNLNFHLAHLTITSLIRFTFLHYPELPLKKLSWKKNPPLKSATTTIYSFINIIKTQQILTKTAVIVKSHGRLLQHLTLNLTGEKNEKKC